MLKTYTKRFAGTIENRSTKFYKNKSDFYKTEVKEFDNENEDGEINDEQQEQITQKMYQTLEIKQRSEVKEQYSTDGNFVTEGLEPGEINYSKQQLMAKDFETGEIVDLDK